MKSRVVAGLISVAAALLLTWGFAQGTGEDLGWPSSLRGLLILSVLIFGLVGNVAVWIAAWLHSQPSWQIGSLSSYVIYFGANACFFLGVLWTPRSDFERKIVFLIRLPFFILLTPIFWCAVIISAPRVIVREFWREPIFATPLRMWADLVNWLRGSPPEYR